MLQTLSKSHLDLNFKKNTKQPLNFHLRTCQVSVDNTQMTGDQQIEQCTVAQRELLIVIMHIHS